MTQVARFPITWIKRSNCPPTRYHVRAWGSARRPDLNYESDHLPFGLEHRYPFVDIQPIERKPAPIKDPHHGQEASL